MKRKLQNIINKLYPLATLLIILMVWQGIVSFELVPSFMLPSPKQVLDAFIEDFDLLVEHSKVTLIEAFFGLSLGVVFGYIIAVFMDRFEIAYKLIYPVVVLTQTIPTVAIAPLLVLWLGYEMTPKIVLIVIATFFPIAIGTLDGFKSVDKDEVALLKSMGANRFQIFRYIKFPGSLSHFFAGLRMSVAYSIVGAVISEWLGGFNGLGVYMTRVKKSFSFDKMFAVIFLISIISLVLMKMVDIWQKKAMPWENNESIRS